MRRIRRRNKVKRLNITILLLAGFLLSVFCLVIRFADYASGRKEYRQLQEQLEAFADSLSNQTEEWNWNREEEEEEDEWTRLMISRNPDYVFWLWISGTNISYPVVKNTIPGYYLNHTFSGKENPCGSIFCGEGAENLIIYGHNMKDGSMFGDLKQYVNEDYFREHRYIMIYCQGDWQRYMIFSCYIIREEEVGVYQSYFNNEEEKRTYLNNIERKSLYLTGRQPEITDSIITLSTCMGKGKRVIVQAVLL